MTLQWDPQLRIRVNYKTTILKILEKSTVIIAALLAMVIRYGWTEIYYI